MSGLISIYGLCDPLTLKIRYIGKSVDPKDRLRRHLSATSLRADSPKNRWLRKLLQLELKPILVILQEVPEDRWAEAERAWIVQFRMIGAELTNSSDGGEGVLPPTPETYQRQRRPPAKLRPKKPPRKEKKKVGGKSSTA